MGWNIYAYIEWERLKKPIFLQEYARVKIYGGISTGLLVGSKRHNITSLFAPRGFPKDLSWSIIYEHAAYVRENAKTEPLPGFPCVTPRKAQELAQTDKYHFVEPKKQWVIGANHPSYLFSYELETLLIEHHKLTIQHSEENSRERQLGLIDSFSLKAALAAMQTIEMNDDWRTRFTYWVN